MRIEQAILSNLIHNEEFCRKAVPHLKTEYFADRKESAIAKILVEFFEQYNKPASPEILAIEIGNIKGLTDKEVPEFQEYAKQLTNKEPNEEWLIGQTEKFCKDRAVYNAILKSIQIIDGRDKVHQQDAIPTILSEALGVCFDNHVGHDYIQDANDRYDFYHRVEEKIAFDLEMFNKITKGGLSKKTLNIALAGTGVGKSLFMCHVGASVLMQGKNVLYITMEMAEERIAERIDANLLNLTMDELKVVDRDIFDSRLQKIATKTQGTLIVKEYPTAGAHAGHFKALLNELELKQKFHPDIIMIDYLNICSSSRLKASSAVNSYTLVKSIAEELRGLAVEYDVPVLTATQTTRSGYSNTDVELTDTSESFGLPATADLMFALISTEELEALNQLMVKQLKNRYNDPTSNRKFIIGIDRARMKLYDVEARAQRDISDSGQEENKDEFNIVNRKLTRDFSSIKI